MNNQVPIASTCEQQENKKISTLINLDISGEVKEI